ncbi:HIT family protein [Sulfurospirillum deleyianum]|uniref:Histidine triad (HIT) protein n=1 Tax=Sulfurospirillum deleyianum (strain ATCC 51133 / DSM 6946 / 5175) TaxID=525898 RepID=D1B2K5_SULD5|nr:HIT domain-containing protein [Sulfurospirillum deleyianum]ACZ12325.1 histidine triad (HIT) protein [Sulfurospirillum deleyianum DSM 6946]
MDYMYAPWRSAYFSEKPEGCVFCNITNHPQKDEEHHVLYRDEHCFIVMNRYPYSPGHFMVIPHHHTDCVEALSPEVWMHISFIVQRCIVLLKEGIGAQGVNLGMNLGKSGGAGIAEHIHYHVIPRWLGDTNFITTIADSRVYGADFEKIYTHLKGLIPKYLSC